MSNKFQAIGAMGLGLSATALMVAGFGDRNPLPIASGAILAASGVGLCRRYSLSGQDFSDGFQEFGLCLDSAHELLTSTGHDAAQVMLKYVPPAYRPFLEQQAEKLLEEDWLPGMLHRSKMVIGGTGSGKTVLQLLEVYTFLKETDGRGRLLICDVNYGKPIGATGEPNTWWNLPRDYIVRTDAPSVFDALKETWDELQARKREAIALADRKRETELRGETFTERSNFQDWLLLIDEGLVTLDAFERIDEELKSEALGYIGDLLFEGRAYNVRITFVVQTPLANESGIGRGKLQQMNFLVLGDSATDPEVLIKVPGVSPQAAREWVRKVDGVKQQRGCKYAAFVKRTDATPALSVRVVPTIDLSEYKGKIIIPEDLNPQRTWLEQILTEELEQQIRHLADRYNKGHIRSPWRQVLKLVGLDKDGKRRAPTEYDAIRGYWESLLTHPETEEN